LDDETNAQRDQPAKERRELEEAHRLPRLATDKVATARRHARAAAEQPLDDAPSLDSGGGDAGLF
jgi:hypothetical protein